MPTITFPPQNTNSCALSTLLALSYLGKYPTSTALTNNRNIVFALSSIILSQRFPLPYSRNSDSLE